MKFYRSIISDIRVLSHPTRGAWIEIKIYPMGEDFAEVAPHTGCVD